MRVRTLVSKIARCYSSHSFISYWVPTTPQALCSALRWQWRSRQWNWELSPNWKETASQWGHIRFLQWNPTEVNTHRKNHRTLWKMSLWNESLDAYSLILTDVNESTCSGLHSGRGCDFLRHPVQFELKFLKVVDLKDLNYCYSSFWKA